MAAAASESTAAAPGAGLATEASAATAAAPAATSSPTGFAIGDDASHPERLVHIDRFIWERTVVNGVMGLGSDVAVAHLVEAVTDIRPVYAAEAQRYELQRSFRAVGFGTTSYVDQAAPYGTRRQARLSLAALGPTAYFLMVYVGDFAQYLADYVSGTTLDPADPLVIAAAQAQWDGTLLEPHYDALFTRITGNTAPGDSGGPIFSAGREDGDDDRLRTVGVVSGIVTISANYPDAVVENPTSAASTASRVVSFPGFPRVPAFRAQPVQR